MVDVGSLLQKLEKSEKVRAEVEQKVQLLEEKTGENRIGCVSTSNTLSGYLYGVPPKMYTAGSSIFENEM